MLRLENHQWKVLNRIRRKHKVSLKFLQFNLPNILKFITFCLRLRIVLKHCAVRRKNKVVLNYKKLSRLTFDDDLIILNERKRAKRRSQILKQWSKDIVQYLRRVIGATVYEEILPKPKIPAKDIVNEMKKQLELLNAGKRSQQLIREVPNDATPQNFAKKFDESVEPMSEVLTEAHCLDSNDNEKRLVLNEKTGVLEESLNSDNGETYLLNEKSGFFEKITLPVVIDLDNSVEEEEEEKEKEKEKDGINHTEKTEGSKTLHAAVDNRIDVFHGIEIKNTISKETVKQDFNNIDIPKSTADILKEKTEMDTDKAISADVNKTNKIESPTKGRANILDVLMQKVFAPKTMKNNSETPSPEKKNSSMESILETDADVDSSEEFLGFADDGRIPGMMRTPLVRYSCEENSAFISRSLDEYFRDNALDTSVDVAQLTKLSINRKLRQSNIDGLMTLNCQPPHLSMPALPESLLKLRTVAERRQYLQKLSRTSKLLIINNEASIYRELQRKIKHPRVRCSTQQALQTSSNSQIPFTRQGWQAASFINTELNKYFFQKLIVKESKSPKEECLILRGVHGNNAEKFKPIYSSRPPREYKSKCSDNCVDCHIAPYLKPMQTFASKKKLNNEPIRPLFKPCPLSHKPRQQLYNREAAEVGDMAVVRLPTVELAVTPELGKSFNEIAKRYLQLITPFNNITREWAEFSVSTLQTLSKKSKILKNPFHRTFVFTIPYANDRSQILVRRILHREEEVDPFFRKREDVPRSSGLSFRKNINKEDKVLMECADVLTDMINSVAISCCEDSFIRDDTTGKVSLKEDHTNVVAKSKAKPLLKVVNTQKGSPGQNSNARLFKELRRLNATIIDTKSQPKDEDHICQKEFCKLGCICGSLNYQKGTDQHCGKLKCMFQCFCNASSASQIVRLESDGRSITTEDAFMMRRQATARLARMEKEFTSTIVVTENETLLINDSAYEKRRRAARVPKRYEDYRPTDDEFSRLSPARGSLTESSELRSPSTSYLDRLVSERKQEPVIVKDVVLQKLKHCSVPLVPFDKIDNMAVFCLVHQLYKCFCGGHATEGKRVIIEKEISETTKLESSHKSRYSFEKSEDQLSLASSTATATTTNSNNATENASVHSAAPSPTPKSHKEAIATNPRSLLKRTKENDVQIKKSANIDKSNETLDEFASSRPKKEKSSEPVLDRADIIKEYQKEQNILTAYSQRIKTFGCSRTVPIPSRACLSRNRKRVDVVLRDVQATESRSTQLLLNEHIVRSVYFHKEMVKAEKAKLEMQLEDKLKQQDETNKALKLKRRASMPAVPMPMTKQPKMEIEHTEEESMNVEDEDLTKHSTLISQCYSLTSVDEPAPEIITEEEDLSEAKSTPEEATSSPAPLVKEDEYVMRENYNEVIKTLNGLVSKKMQDIDNALKRESKNVPEPSEDILCVLRWRNFAEAYRANTIFVWEVKMKTRHFFAATIKDIMPIVPGALGVMNLLAVPTERLPLIGRMLMLPFIYNKAINLAVIMQGRSQFWYIKGFLEPSSSKPCLRPTPETHPELSLKINTLCSSLVKQRSREQERLTLVHKMRHQRQQQEEMRTYETTQAKKQETNLTPLTPLTSAAPTANTKKKPFRLTLLKNCMKKSNIVVRRATPDDISKMEPPLAYSFDHRWFVLDWATDFSHIFMPELKELISYENISRLQRMTALKKTVHRMEFQEKNNFAAYFVPISKQKIYFGPLFCDQPPPVLVLMQKVNGEMMPREVYEKLRLLKPHSKITTAFWMTQLNGKMYFDQLTTSNKSCGIKDIPETKTSTTATSESNINHSEDEDDCIFVENEQQKVEETKSNDAIELNKPIKTTTTTITKSDENSLNNFSPKIFTIVTTTNTIPTTSEKTMTTTSNTKKKHLNFTIQTSAATNALKISTADGFELTHTTEKLQGLNANKAESKAKILSVFKLPPLLPAQSTSPITTAPLLLEANKRHSLNLQDTSINSSITSTKTVNSLNRSLSEIDQTSKSYQKINKVVSKPKSSLMQQTKALNKLPTNSNPNEFYQLGVKPVSTSKTKPSSITSTTITSTIAMNSENTGTTSSTNNLNFNTQSPQEQATTNAPILTGKTANVVPVNIMKAPTAIKTTPERLNETMAENAAHKISNLNTQRLITIKRIEKDAISSANAQANTSTSTLNSIKRLSSGIIKIPVGALKPVGPIYASNSQRKLTTLPTGIKIAKTTITPTSTSQAVYPVNLLAAPQSRVTPINFNQTLSQNTKTSTLFCTKTPAQSCAETANLRLIQSDKNAMSSDIITQKSSIQQSMTKIQPPEQTSTTPNPQCSATKIRTNPLNFLAKKTAAPNAMWLKTQASNKKTTANIFRKILPKEISKEEAIGLKTTRMIGSTLITPSTASSAQSTKPQSSTQQNQQQPQSLEKSPIKELFSTVSDDSDVILIDD